MAGDRDAKPGDTMKKSDVGKTEKDKGVLSTHLHSEGKYAKELWLESPSSKVRPRITQELLDKGSQYLKMNGREVFRHAVTRFPEVIEEALKEKLIHG